MIKSRDNIFPFQNSFTSIPQEFLYLDYQVPNQGEISFLTNTNFWFFDCVYVRVEKNGFRLFVKHSNHTVFDKIFSSLRGTRIAFSKLFRERALKARLKAQWSPFYEPEAGWLDKKIDMQTPGNRSVGERDEKGE